MVNSFLFILVMKYGRLRRNGISYNFVNIKVWNLVVVHNMWGLLGYGVSKAVCIL